MKIRAIITALTVGASALVIGGTTLAAPSPATPDCVPDASSAAGGTPVSTGPGSIAGTVGVGGGDTIEDVGISIRNNAYSQFFSTQTDVDGNYSFAGLPYDDYLIEISDASYPNAYYCGATDEFSATLVTIDVGTPHVDDVDMLVGPATISGTITDGTNPIEFAQIQVEMQDPESPIRLGQARSAAPSPPAAPPLRACRSPSMTRTASRPNRPRPT